MGSRLIVVKFFKITLIFILVNIIVIPVSIAQKRLEKLPAGINTDEYDEVSPVLDEEYLFLFFTRIGDPDFIKAITTNEEDQDEEVLKEIFTKISGNYLEVPQHSSFNQDIYYSKITLDGFSAPIHPGYPINNAYPNSVCATFPEENALIVINRFDEKGGLEKGFSKVQYLENDAFGFPTPMEIRQFNNLGNNVNFSMSKDGEQIFIAMENEASEGETDIFLSIRIGKNQWSKPTPLNSPVNTKYKENAPFISADKKKLYFSSNRPGGIGGMDIYVAYRLDYTYLNWTRPQLLQEPINSKADESHPFLDQNDEYLYFNSNRDGTSDIFRYNTTETYSLAKELVVALKIIDAGTGQLTRGEIQWGVAHQKEYEGFFRTYSGEYEITIMEDERFRFKVNKPGYTGTEVILDPAKIINDDVTRFELTLYVQKGIKPPVVQKLPFFGTEKKVTLKNIYFERAEAKVLPNSYAELQELADVLKSYPELYILIEGHTDNVGEKKLLLALSEDRASSIKDYLVTQGINPIRIEVSGLGDTFPLNDNGTENERKRNRRVEIKIIDKIE